MSRLPVIPDQQRNCWLCALNEEDNSCAVLNDAVEPKYSQPVDDWCQEVKDFEDGMPPRQTAPCPMFKRDPRKTEELPPAPKTMIQAAAAPELVVFGALVFYECIGYGLALENLGKGDVVSVYFQGSSRPRLMGSEAISVVLESGANRHLASANLDFACQLLSETAKVSTAEAILQMPTNKTFPELIRAGLLARISVRPTREARTSRTASPPSNCSTKSLRPSWSTNP